MMFFYTFKIVFGEGRRSVWENKGKIKKAQCKVLHVLSNICSDCSRFIPNEYFSNYWKDNNLDELLVLIPGQSANLANKAVHLKAYATWNL